MKYLLDTNVVSETRRRVPNETVIAWFRRADPSALFLSVLTLGEIAKGAELLARRDAQAGTILNRWLEGLRNNYADRIIGIDAEIAQAWGRMAAARPIPVIDSLLAATASVQGMTFVTRNERDAAATGIAVLNPWREGP